jgi:hypothetical protein
MVNTRILNAREYITLKQNINTKASPIKRTVTVFEYNNNYFTLESNENGKQILRVKLRRGEKHFEVPDFLVLGEKVVELK